MPWPDIFFRSKSRRKEQAPPAKSAPVGSTTAAIKPAAIPAPEVSSSKVEPTEKGKGPLPMMEKPALRPAVYATKPVNQAKPATVAPASSEAESLRAFARANSIRLAKRPQVEPLSPQTGPILTTSKSTPTSSAEPVAAPSTPSTPPPDSPPVEPAAAKETPADAPSIVPAPEAPKIAINETPLAASTPVPEPEAPKPSVAEPAPTPPATTGTTRAKRRMKLTDLARMIFSPAPMEAPPTPEPQSAVSPPAFTVPVPIGSATQPDHPPQKSEASVIEVVREDKPVAPADTKPAEAIPVPASETKESPETKAPTSPTPTPESEKKPETPSPEKSPGATPNITSGPLPVPPAEKPPVSAKPDKPEATAPSVPVESTLAHAPERKEFLLVNGERILGNVLSENPENIYLNHDTLGVLTLPRSQIAHRPVEIILINGDRIVGDIMAETPDTLYVRHASLGMLTVPRSQRSTRVIEALLKDGDRILGEVLAETENFTVIRSATLGTVAVPHNKVAMLNRKVEQIELKAVAPSIEDKPTA